MKVSCHAFMAHEISRTAFHGNFMPHESLPLCFIAHEMFYTMFSWKIHESLNEMVLFSWKIHGHEYSHGIYFAVFTGHEMPFMGFSLDIHGIFIQLCFIV